MKKGARTKGKTVALLDDADTEPLRTPIIQFTTLDVIPSDRPGSDGIFAEKSHV